VNEGCAAGTFRPVHTADEVVDFLLVSLAGIMIPRVLHHGRPTVEGFRDVLLSQLRNSLGLPA
jgi:hypothetical protein